MEFHKNSEILLPGLEQIRKLPTNTSSNDLCCFPTASYYFNSWYEFFRTIFKFYRLNTGVSHADNKDLPCFTSSLAYWALEHFLLDKRQHHSAIHKRNAKGLLVREIFSKPILSSLQLFSEWKWSLLRLARIPEGAESHSQFSIFCLETAGVMIHMEKSAYYKGYIGEEFSAGQIGNFHGTSFHIR